MHLKTVRLQKIAIRPVSIKSSTECLSKFYVFYLLFAFDAAAEASAVAEKCRFVRTLDFSEFSRKINFVF